MFELRMVDGNIFKQIIDAIKDLVTDGNLECTPEEVTVQCMDSSHVALVAMSLTQDSFDHYRCDRPCSIGINMSNFAKVLKLMKKEDVLVLKRDDDADVMNMMFENPKTDGIADFGTFFASLFFLLCEMY
jgi:proliferating cell nuclear antigen